MSKSKTPAPPLLTRPHFDRWAAAAIAAAFILMALQYLRSDLWFDELLTLGDYVVRRPLSAVFTHYKVANNHILFSALLWLWTRVVGYGSELGLRLPNLVLALAGGGLLYWHGRKLYDRGLGFLAALTLLFSPVYLAFFWQLRGYGLTLFLGILATLGALYLARGSVRRGLWLYVPAAVLLPGVIPSNVLLPLCLWLYVTVIWGRQHQWRQHWRVWLLTGAVSGAGMLLYAPIAAQLTRVLRETHGWDSGWLVAGHWLLAMAAHGGLLALALAGFHRRQRAAAPAKETVADKEVEQRVRAELPWLFVCTAVPLLLVAVLRAPYPRGLLVFLAPLTLAPFALYRPQSVRPNPLFGTVLFLILANCTVGTRLADWHMREQLVAGRAIPQNLVEQYYTRNLDVSTTAGYLRRRPELLARTQIFIDFHFYKSLQSYWQAMGGDPTQVDSLYHGEVPLFPLQRPRRAYAVLPQLVLAYNVDRAAALYEQATGRKVQFELLPSPTRLKILRVLPAGAPPPRPPAAKPPKPGVQI